MKSSRAHDAVEFEDLDALAAALEEGGDVNERTADGMTLLHHAIDIEVDGAWQTGQPLRVETTKFLVDRGADLTLRWQGQTPLEAAESWGHHLAARLIRAAGAGPAQIT